MSTRGPSGIGRSVSEGSAVTAKTLSATHSVRGEPEPGRVKYYGTVRRRIFGPVLRSEDVTSATERSRVALAEQHCIGCEVVQMNAAGQTPTSRMDRVSKCSHSHSRHWVRYRYAGRAVIVGRGPPIETRVRAGRRAVGERKAGVKQRGIISFRRNHTLTDPILHAHSTRPRNTP